MKPFSACRPSHPRLLARPARSTTSFAADTAAAQTPPARRKKSTPMSAASTGCRRAPTIRASAISRWVGKKGPTGHERIIYGTYTISDSAECQKKRRARPMSLEPHDAALEAAATAYADAVGRARAAAQGGRRLLHAGGLQGRQDGQGQGPASRSWSPPGTPSPPPTKKLRAEVDAINDKRAAEKLAEIEQSRRPQAGAVSYPGADDPGQARAAQRGRRQTRRRRHRRGRSRITKTLIKGAETVFRQRAHGQEQDRLDVHQLRQVVS